MGCHKPSILHNERLPRIPYLPEYSTFRVAADHGCESGSAQDCWVAHVEVRHKGISTDGKVHHALPTESTCRWSTAQRKIRQMDSVAARRFIRQ